MKRFKNILVLYDDAVGGDDVIGQAVALARENMARLTITTVLRESNISPAIINETEKRLQRLAQAVCHPSIPAVRTKVLVGTPFMLIIREVIGARYDLVITCAKSGNALQNVFFGSTATHLMRKCPCPVWVVKPGQSVPFTNILAAVDPQPEASLNQLNVKILDLATSLASRDHAVLHIVHAWDVDGKDYDTVRSEIDAHQLETILKQHNAKHGSALASLLERYPMREIDHCIHLLRDRPAQAVTQIVDQEQIDLVVMGTAARTGIPGLLIGNSAETMMGSVKCGMLTVKPPGFETTIAPPDPVFSKARQRGSARGEVHPIN